MSVRTGQAHTCKAVREDETDTSLDMEALSMRGAQREITAFMLKHGYKPAGRWRVEATDDSGDLETYRLFAPARDDAWAI